MRLLENPVTQQGIEMIAHGLLRTWAKKIPGRFLQMHADRQDPESSWYDVEWKPEDIEPVTFRDAFPSFTKGPMSRFIEAMKDNLCVIRLTSDLQQSDASGEYVWYRGQPEIRIHLVPEKLDLLVRWADSGQLNSETVFYFLRTYLSILIHELVHAYDDWVSEGRYTNNRRSIKADNTGRFDLYMNNPVEINARYAETVSSIAPFIKADWPDYLAAFKRQMEGWRELQPSDKRRLVLRLAAQWRDGKTPWGVDVRKAVERLRDRLRAAGLDTIVSYTPNSGLVVEKIDSTDGDIVFRTLKVISTFADLYGLEVALPFWEPEAPQLGFRSQNGRHYNHALPHATQMWRAPKGR
jgi:hypothetical protein